MARVSYLRAISARTIQSFARCVNATRPYAAKRDNSIRWIPEARAIVAYAASNREAEINVSRSNWTSMVTFLEEGTSSLVSSRLRHNDSTADCVNESLPEALLIV